MRLSSKDIATLRDMAEAGWTQARMAKVLGVSQSTIHSTLIRKNIPHNTRIGRRFSPSGKPDPLVRQVREEWEARGLYMAEIARRAGYHDERIRNWAHGVNMMPVPCLRDLVDVLGGTIEIKFPDR